MKLIAWVLACLISQGTTFGQTAPESPDVRSPAKSELQIRGSDVHSGRMISLTYPLSPDKEAFKSLLRNGASPNACDRDGMTALINVVLRADTRSKGGPLDEPESAAWLDVARLLLDSGADPSKSESKRGFTPLMAAAAHGLSNAVELLVRYKADVNAQTLDGCSALFYAARDNDVVILKLLVNAGGDVNGGKDLKPLHMAARGGCREAVAFLLAHNANVNAVNNDRRTPLGEAQNVLMPLLDNPTLNSDQIAQLKTVIALLREHGGKE